MSIEAKYLADKINRFDESSETAKDQKVYDEGLNLFQSITRDITFIQPRGLKLIPDMLDENGKKMYEKRFKKYIDQEIINQSKKR